MNHIQATYNDVVDLLVKKNIVCIHQGRTEAGPRALGNRSVLYDPRDSGAQRKVNSAKGRHFEFNKNFSMCFYWESIEKQIRIVGKGRLVENKMSEEYFFSRQRGSKIGAWVSDQSSEIPGEHHLENRQKYFINKFRNKEVPRPKYWVGIKVIPEEFEFWQRGKFRLHKREFYSLKNKKWEMKVLAP